MDVLNWVEFEETMSEGTDYSGTATNGSDSPDHDSFLSWGYAANLNLDRGRGARPGPALEEYQRRFTDYADTLLRDLGADAGRLSAVIAHHRDVWLLSTIRWKVLESITWRSK